MAKYCQLRATLELTERYLGEQLSNNDIFTSPKQVEDYLSVQMRDYQREVFSVLLLDSRHQLLGYHELFYGTVDTTSVHPRKVVKLALERMPQLSLLPTIIRRERRYRVMPTLI